jgi:alpha-tubulin suppressor-like RCC1 family protein
LATAEPQRTAAIYASKMFSCALSERGALQCWGKTGSYFGRPGRVGHVGDDELPSDVPPLDFGGRAVVDLAVSYWSTHLCALLDDGSARCWGDNGEGQLGAGPGVGDLGDAAGESPGNAPALPLENIRSLHTQVGWTCALTGAADASEARCWGRNDFGQLGQGHKRPLSSPPPLPIDFGERTPVQLSMGLYHGCAVLDDGSARCWGSNGKHQLGNGLPISVYVGDGVGEGAAAGTERPNTNVFDVSGLGELDASLVRANGGWACVLTSDDRVRCWGGNKRGTLGYRWDQIEGCTADGLGDSCKVLTASTDVDLGEHGGSHLVDLQQGRQRACVLDDAGAVRCWGHASNGALGYGAALEAAAPAGFIGHRTSPAEVYAALGTDGVVDIGDADGDGAIDRVTQLAVGYDHVCVLVADGSVRCWGGNDYGQLGYGTLQDVGDDETPAEFYAEHGDGAVSLWPAD